MPLIFYALGYLFLQDTEKRTMARRDAFSTLVIALVISLPFLLIADANFYGVDGFLSNMVSLSSALAGFYVAALVAAATLARGSDLDKVIQVGKIYRAEQRDGELVRDPLSRREYVCAIFGYLSFVSFAVTIVAGYLVSISQSKTLGTNLSVPIAADTDVKLIDIVSPIGTFLLCLVIAHMFVVTSYGLYYLISRLYEQAPKVVAANDKAHQDAEKSDRKTTKSG